MNRLANISECIDDIRDGKMIILVDDEDRENEGDIVIAAEKITPQAVNFMATHARGLICVALSGDRVDKIGLKPMVRRNRAPLGTAFTVSVDAVGTSSGISARDRSDTIQQLIKDDCTLQDLRVPGHTFPLKAQRGGVLIRAGQTEGSVDLARLAGLKTGAVICEIMKDDGTMARLDDLLAFGETHDIKVASIADLIEYRLREESLVRVVARVDLPTEYGRFQAIAFENELDTHIHLALVMGQPTPDKPTLVRVHRADLVADVFQFTGDRQINRLDSALRQISEAGAGVLLYLRTGAGGEMALDGLRSYLARRRGEAQPAKSTKAPPMSFREFGVGAQILRTLGLGKILAISNRPQPFHGLSGFGIEIVDWVPMR
jgi:3,4-dihydroxy 2-butanone 4-phosphate synthase/GTP cyclohydrolase II